MSQSSVTSLLATHLGLPAHAAGLVATRSFRSITVTAHRVTASEWRWRPESIRNPRAMVLFVTGTSDDSRMGVYLPSHARRTVSWKSDADLLAVWIPEQLIREFTEGDVPDASDLFATPLTVGYRDFALSIVQHAAEGSSMSQYAIERLLAEMTFGTLLEQSSIESDPNHSSLVDRARTLMLVHREDPQFSTPQLAAELHISQRQLQRAFAQAGTTPGELLRRMRVDLADSMLRNPLYSGLTIEQVSQYAGFTSALQLRRALHAEGFPSPTQLRRTAEQISDD